MFFKFVGTADYPVDPNFVQAYINEVGHEHAGARFATRHSRPMSAQDVRQNELVNELLAIAKTKQFRENLACCTTQHRGLCRRVHKEIIQECLVASLALAHAIDSLCKKPSEPVDAADVHETKKASHPRRSALGRMLKLSACIDNGEQEVAVFLYVSFRCLKPRLDVFVLQEYIPISAADIQHPQNHAYVLEVSVDKTYQLAFACDDWKGLDALALPETARKRFAFRNSFQLCGTIKQAHPTAPLSEWSLTEIIYSCQSLTVSHVCEHRPMGKLQTWYGSESTKQTQNPFTAPGDDPISKAMGLMFGQPKAKPAQPEPSLQDLLDNESDQESLLDPEDWEHLLLEDIAPVPPHPGICFNEKNNRFVFADGTVAGEYSAWPKPSFTNMRVKCRIKGHVDCVATATVNTLPHSQLWEVWLTAGRDLVKYPNATAHKELWKKLKAEYKKG